jgi:hypothetical protein
MESLGGVSGPLALVLVLVRETYNFLNHKKIRFRCCSRNMDISLDVDSTSRQTIHSLPNSAAIGRPKSPIRAPQRVYPHPEEEV